MAFLRMTCSISHCRPAQLLHLALLPVLWACFHCSATGAVAGSLFLPVNISRLPPLSAFSRASLHSNASIAPIGDIFIECNGRQYGRPIATSCLDAWRTMPDDEIELTFADRSQKLSSDVVLPWRFSSCKKLCDLSAVFLHSGQLKAHNEPSGCKVQH